MALIVCSPRIKLLMSIPLGEVPSVVRIDGVHEKSNTFLKTISTKRRINSLKRRQLIKEIEEEIKT
jgi:hypothetical protein